MVIHIPIETLSKVIFLTQQDANLRPAFQIKSIHDKVFYHSWDI